MVLYNVYIEPDNKLFGTLGRLAGCGFGICWGQTWHRCGILVYFLVTSFRIDSCSGIVPPLLRSWAALGALFCRFFLFKKSPISFIQVFPTHEAVGKLLSIGMFFIWL